MKMKLIGESLGANLSSMASHDQDYKEGDRGEVRLYLDTPLAPDVIKDMERELLDRGVVLTENIRQDAGIVVIRFKKAIAPLIIVAAVVGAVGLVLSALLGWQIFKFKQAGIPNWVIVLGGAALLYFILRSPPVKATGRAAVTGARWYAGRKMAGIGAPLQLPSPRTFKEEEDDE